MVIVLLALVARMFAKRAIRLMVARAKKEGRKVRALEERAETLGSVLSNATDLLLLLVALMMILSEWGVDITPIITGAGILGLAFGFGAQTLVKDLVTGFFILLENQFNAGDTVEVAGVEGEVVQMNLRTTVLKGEDGQIHIIPNSAISKVSKKESTRKGQNSQKPKR